MPKLKLVIKDRTLELIDILECIDKAIASVLDQSTSVNAVGKQDGLPVYEIALPTAWLYLARRGLLTVTSNSADLMPCFLRVGHESQRRSIKVHKKFGKVHSERVHFLSNPLDPHGRTDLDYPDIAASFDRLFPTDRQPQAAEAIISFACGIQVNGFDNPQLDFIAGMAVLLFGLEASRLNSALLSGVMMLDLIAQRKHYGRKAKLFTLRGVFSSEYVWDKRYTHDPSHPALYGGKYPQAVYEHGSGNMSARREMANSDHRKYGPEWTDHVLLLNDRHSVARREVTLAVHWLQAQRGDTIYQCDVDFIRNLLIARLTMVFVHRLPRIALAHEPSAFTGTARTDMSHVAPGYFFYYKGGFHFHLNPDCKLIPSQFKKTNGPLTNKPPLALLQWEETTYKTELILKGDNVGKRLEHFTLQEIDDPSVANLAPCPCCCKILKISFKKSMGFILQAIETADNPYELLWIMSQIAVENLPRLVAVMTVAFVGERSKHLWRALDAMIQLTEGDEALLCKILTPLSLEQHEQLAHSYEQDLDIQLAYDGKVDDDIQRAAIQVIESNFFI